MAKGTWYNPDLQAAYERGETVIINTTPAEQNKAFNADEITFSAVGSPQEDPPPLEAGDQLVVEGHDKKVIRDGKVIWHSPGSVWITCA